MMQYNPYDDFLVSRLHYYYENRATAVNDLVHTAASSNRFSARTFQDNIIPVRLSQSMRPHAYPLLTYDLNDLGYAIQFSRKKIEHVLVHTEYVSVTIAMYYSAQ